MIATWRMRGWDLWGGAVMGTAGRRRGLDGWPGQRRVDVGGVKGKECRVVGGCGGASNCGSGQLCGGAEGWAGVVWSVRGRGSEEGGCDAFQWDGDASSSMSIFIFRSRFVQALL